MIDRQKFDDTFQYFDVDLILKIIDMFEEELPGRLEKIGRNIREKDYPALAFNAHSLKSVAGTFMDNEPCVLAEKISELAKKGAGNDLEVHFEKLRSASEELARELTLIRREFAERAS